MRHNAELLSQLDELAHCYKLIGDKQRDQSYRAVILSLESFFSTNPGLIQESDYRKRTPGRKSVSYPLKAVGKGASIKIDQYLKNGIVQEVQICRDGGPRGLSDYKAEKKGTKKKSEEYWAIHDLQRISYIGADAKKLVRKGVKNVEDLLSRSDADLKQLLKPRQYFMAKHFRDLQKRIPKNVTKCFALGLNAALKAAFGPGDWEVVFGGSYRRGAKDSGDMDVVVRSRTFSLREMVEVLKEMDFIVEVLSHGLVDFKAIAKCPGWSHVFRLDVIFVQRDNWVSALIYYTGNDTLNRQMRLSAKKKGWIFSQNGLTRIGDRKKVVKGGLVSERQAFELLEHPYLPPERRGKKFRF